MSKRTIFPAKVVPEIETNYNNLVKWVPLLCAGAAAGISIIALKEIKSIKNEILTLKSKGSDSELNKKMENMEEQLKTITNYLKSKSELPKRTPQPSPQPPPPKENTIIKNVIKEQPEVKIINEDEYEEVEVTDDEAE